MSVLLGVCDAEVGGDGFVDWSSTKIGGTPNWMPFRAEWPKCIICQESCVFIVQVYCPIGDSLFHRTLYVFACRKKSCWNKAESWCVIRGQYQEVDDKKGEEQPAESSIDWGCDADDWGGDDDWGDGGEMDLTSQLDQMNLNPTENLVTPNSLPGSVSKDDNTEMSEEASMSPISPSLPTDVCDYLLVPYYVAVIEEPSEKEESPYTHEGRLMKEYAKQEGIDLNTLLECDPMETGGAQEKYEKSEAPHGDVVFKKFKKRILRCPQQILRYEYGGQPLNVKKPRVDSIPPCEQCGQPRIFEAQLMPALLSHLRFNKQSEEVIEFGTVQIYTCKESCWSNQSARNEYVIVQDDPDQHLFR